VPLVAAAVCPCPPLLVPEVAAGAAAELDDLRAACDEAVARLRAAAPDVLVLLGTGEETGWRSPDEYGSLRPWGVPLDVGLNGRGRPTLPLSLTIGGWLLSRQAHPVAPGTGLASIEVAGIEVASTEFASIGVASVGAEEKPAGCAAFGRDEVATRGDRVALLVIGDGSALGAVQATGRVDPRAEAYDAQVARALGAADVDALLALDPAGSAEILAAGRPAWQALAGAAAGTGREAELLYSAAPYGVRYHVASWVAR
jgi:hypothetical protein